MAEKVNGADKLSARQLAVAWTVAGLSPAAVCTGRVPWFWVLLWSLVGAVLAALVFWCGRKCAVRGMGMPVRVLYGAWAVVLSSRVLSAAAERLEQTSGGSPGFWLMIILLVPLLLVGWGRSAPFFRMVEVLWLVMAAVLLLVFVLGVGRIELRYVLTDAGDWKAAAVGAAEVFVPVLYALPYIYNVSEDGTGGKMRWLFAPGALCAGMCLLTAGVLGAGGELVPQPFFVAAGTVGRSARLEGLLSVIWLLPDLVLVGLLCRSWGEKRWPVVAVLLSAAGSLLGISNYFSTEFYAVGSLILAIITLICFAGRRNFVVKKTG